MFNGISAFTQLADAFRSGDAGQDRAGNSRAAARGASVYQYSASLDVSRTQVSLSSDSGVQVSSRQFSAQIVEFRLAGRLNGFANSGGKPPAEAYQPSVPSPQDVANRVLGFVEQRIAREAEAGASDEELAALFEQAAEGVQRGYAEAIDEIDSRGLMSDELEEDINEGFGLIQSGLEELRSRFLPESDEAVAAVTETGATEKSNVVADSEPVPAAQQTASAASADNESADEAADAPAVQSPVFSRFAQALAYQRTQYASNDVGITLTTRDGDKVTLYAGAASGSIDRGVYMARGDREFFGASSSSFQQSGLMLRVDGELDAEEMAALEDMLAQVEGIASSFFNGDLDQAFAAALDLDVDMGEIASYSINMNSVRYEEVGVRYQGGRSAGAERFQPLADQVPKFSRALENAARFAEPANLIRDLLDRYLGQQEQGSGTEGRSVQPMQRFADSLLSRLA